MTIARLLPTLLCVTLFTTPAWSKNWIVDKEASQLTFEADQFGTGFTGQIENYNAQIFFDPENLDATNVIVEIDIASISTGDPQRDVSIRGLEWFATENFPKAEFKATQARHLEGRRYALDGTLTIKGISNEVSLEFDFNIENERTKVDGDLIVARNDFKIGEGQFAVSQVSALDVKVHIDLVAKPSQ